MEVLDFSEMLLPTCQHTRHRNEEEHGVTIMTILNHVQGRNRKHTLLIFCIHQSFSVVSSFCDRLPITELLAGAIPFVHDPNLTNSTGLDKLRNSTETRMTTVYDLVDTGLPPTK